jgi:glycosyltransferase involved in cell wall biosynthesis
MPIKQKPKILITVTVAETAYSFFKEQIPYLLEKGYEVELASGEGSWKKLDDVRKAFGVRVHELPLTRTMNVFSDIRSIVRLYLLMRKIRPAILHTSTPKAAIFSLIAGWLARVPVRIYLVRGIAYYHTRGVVRMFLFFLFTQSCRLAHEVLCVSKSNRDFIIKNRICPAEKITIFCNGSSHGVDSSVKFNRKNEDPARSAALRKKYGVGDTDVVFGFTGRIVKDKGIEDLVAAWMLFIKDKKNVHLFIVGHKEARDAVSPSCMAMIKRETSVHVIDDVIDPFDYYCLFDIFVFPSYREGFPNAVLEAGAMELPVVTTDALGCVDSVKDRETGYIVPIKDIGTLINRMENLYRDKEMREAFGRRARGNVIDNFDPAALCIALEQMVRTLGERSNVFPRQRLAIVTSVPATLFHLFSNQVDRIRREGYEVIFISSAGDRWISAEDVEKKYLCQVYRVPFKRTFSVFSDLSALAALCVLLLRVRPGVLYYCTPKASLLTAMAAFVVGVPFRIYSVFGEYYYGRKGLVEKTMLLVEKITCACSHKVIVMSMSNLEYLLRKRLCDPKKLGILGHGTNQGVDAKTRFNPERVDEAARAGLRRRLDIKENTAVFGYVGRLVGEKGIIELVTAWQEVKTDASPCVLLLIGPRKEPREPLPESVFARIAADPTIRLIEPVSNPELYYSIMDVFVLASYREGFPNVVLEASAMEIPVITTDAIGCVDSVVDGRTGFIVPQRNVEKLKEKMLLLLHDPEMRKAMGRRARERVAADFDADTIADELMYLIEKREFIRSVQGGS